ncbi:hypothetical protein [Varunaivibrio sulfuroxidans]|uniref:hypothetical protein n=1 Tax=Varunaivibrio sulfuroxidans TaxID=1773489 RepID=UPI0014043148|nr:hypothetical protein [Varunaivibrio sulfuroxidans]WES31527.1 hypothetical protein P3M64_03925 [Varunaivibrio sulfuroxidans]
MAGAAWARVLDRGPSKVVFSEGAPRRRGGDCFLLGDGACAIGIHSVAKLA